MGLHIRGLIVIHSYLSWTCDCPLCVGLYSTPSEYIRGFSSCQGLVSPCVRHITKQAIFHMFRITSNHVDFIGDKRQILTKFFLVLELKVVYFKRRSWQVVGKGRREVGFREQGILEKKEFRERDCVQMVLSIWTANGQLSPPNYVRLIPGFKWAAHYPINNGRTGWVNGLGHKFPPLELRYIQKGKHACQQQLQYDRKTS